VTSRALVLGAVLFALGCASTVPISSVADLTGEWKGRISNPRGHAPAAMAIGADGGFKGTMFLEGGDQSFRGALVVVRPGQVRYQGTDGNGTVRISEENGRRVLRFLRDDGGVDAVFQQF
jgi:hypothetical protein